MASKASTVFEQHAAKYDCAESDYLLLRREGIVCADDLYFRVNSSQELEDFMREKVFPWSAYLENDQIVTFNRDSAEGDWQEWRRSADAAGLRRLWTISKDLAKKDLEDQPDEGDKPKVNKQVLADLENKAVERGMDAPVSDAERPSTYCLSKVMAITSNCSHLEWEVYSTLEEEEQAKRLGKLKRVQLRVEKHLRRQYQGHQEPSAVQRLACRGHHPVHGDHEDQSDQS